MASKFNNWLNSVADAGRDILSARPSWLAGGKPEDLGLEQLCRDLLSSRGEALGTALARTVVEHCQSMDGQAQQAFFQLLLDEFSVPSDKVEQAIEDYLVDPGPQKLQALHASSEPPRQELFRRMNAAPGGTATIIGLRSELLKLLPEHPEFAVVDADMRHLITSWFNRGFLQLVKIGWDSPAHILEKLISYEAVHSMDGWDDLRRRLADDRRCFAFFHPAMPDEPLIFVQVALTQGLADSVQVLLDEGVEPSMQQLADTAIFYSISDCQQGLRGISLGNFLIKQVVMELQSELPNINRFATLSPIPGFCDWLHHRLEDDSLTEEQLSAIRGCDDPLEFEAIEHYQLAQDLLLKLCCEYLYTAKRGERPLDPVARFHLRNGASIARLNWCGDRSERGIKQSAGIMVNYSYNLKQVESRHEDYVNDNVIAVSSLFEKQVSAL